MTRREQHIVLVWAFIGSCVGLLTTSFSAASEFRVVVGFVLGLTTGLVLVVKRRLK